MTKGKKVETISVNDFIGRLIVDGSYTVMYNLRGVYGDQVAIEFCNQLYPTFNCETVIRVYMKAFFHHIRTEEGEEDKPPKDPKQYLLYACNKYKKAHKESLNCEKFNSQMKKKYPEIIG